MLRKLWSLRKLMKVKQTYEGEENLWALGKLMKIKKTYEG